MPESKVTVYVWTPAQVPRFLGIGHAAIHLKHDRHGHYITWAADGHPLKAPFKFQNAPRWNNVGVGLDYEMDKGNMQHFFGRSEPEFKCELPIFDLKDGILTYGVSAKRIEDFWKQQLTKNTYAFFSAKHNCTGCVWEALKAGGLGNYHDNPDSIFIQGATSLMSAVRKADENLEKLNGAYAKIYLTMRGLSRQYWRHDTVPSLADWKADSDKNAKGLARRRDQIAALDKMIADYPNARSDVAKYILLLQMQKEIYSHLTQKPNSDRKKAVEQLGARVWWATEKLTIDDSTLDDLSDKMYDWAVNTIGWRAKK